MGIICQKLRASARGRPCAFRIPGHCNFDDATTVLCHAPSRVQGMGSKGHDFNAAFGCSNCHEALDHRRVDHPERYWLPAIIETWTQWVLDGLIVIPVDPATAKRRPKRKAKMPSRPFAKRKPVK